MRRSGLQEIRGAVVLAPVNQGDPTPGLFQGLIDIFMLDVPDLPDPLRIRIHQHDREWNAAMVEKVNSLEGKSVTIVINRSPWAACGKTGVVNYLQTIEEI